MRTEEQSNGLYIYTYSWVESVKFRIIIYFVIIVFVFRNTRIFFNLKLNGNELIDFYI